MYYIVRLGAVHTTHTCIFLNHGALILGYVLVADKPFSSLPAGHQVTVFIYLVTRRHCNHHGTKQRIQKISFHVLYFYHFARLFFYETIISFIKTVSSLFFHLLKRRCQTECESIAGRNLTADTTDTQKAFALFSIA